MPVREIFPYTPPFLPHHAALIVLNCGKARVGRWNAKLGGFSYTSNQLELAPEALAAILESYPEVDLTAPEFRVFTCPESLAKRAKYEWWF
jgi:hypothetical protein